VSTDFEDVDMFLSNGTQIPKACDMALRLPVDEDDYLMPSPGPHAQSQGYIDLISDTKLIGKLIKLEIYFVIIKLIDSN
jgi:hypothetical protein